MKEETKEFLGLSRQALITELAVSVKTKHTQLETRTVNSSVR